MSFDLTSFLSVASVVIPAASALASAVNQVIRDKTAAEADMPAWLLHAAAVLNVLSVNLDKAAQLVKMARGK